VKNLGISVGPPTLVTPAEARIGKYAARLSVVPLVALGYSGYFKAAPPFRSVPIDITLLFALVTSLFLFVAILRRCCHDTRAVPVFLGLWGTFTVGAAMDIGAEHSAQKVFYLSSVTLLCAISPCFFFEDPRAKRLFLWSTIFCSSLMGVLAAFSPDLLAQSEFGRFNLDGATTIGTARVFGAGVVVATILALTGSRGRWWWALVAAVFMGLTISVGSRGPVISVLIAVSAALLLMKTVRRRRVWAFSQLLVAVGLMAYSSAVSPTAASDRVRLFLSGDETDVAREFLFSEAWRQITMDPLGVGWGGFGVTHSFDGFNAGQATYPHNIFLEIAVEGGWIAALSFLLVAMLAIRGLVIGSTTPESAALLGLGVYWLAVAQTSSDVNGNRMTWVVLALGLIGRVREHRGYSGQAVNAASRR